MSHSAETSEKQDVHPRGSAGYAENGRWKLIMMLIRDLGKALLLGILLAGCLALIAFLIGLLSGGPTVGMEASSSAVFLVSAVLFFLLAGMMIVKGKKKRTGPKSWTGWRKHFQCLGPEAVLGCMAVGFVIVGAVIDGLS